MKVWLDFTNPPHVNFYQPIIEHLQEKGISTEVTARDFVETTTLLDQKGIQYTSYGKHGGNRRINKIISLINREIQVLTKVRGFSYSLSSNYEAPLASWLKRKKSIVFDDNDISPNWLYAKFANYVVSPKYIDIAEMYKMGIKKDQLICYNGFKEDLYIASFSPDPDFLTGLPFNTFVAVRPENIQASYVPHGVSSIVPELLDKLGKAGKNVLYLPRYKEDYAYSDRMDHVFIPNKPLNGLDVCYYSDAVLTGAGTFSREAALMGKTAVSFFAGKQFLSVDQHLFKDRKILHSRKVDEIIEYVKIIKTEKMNFNRSKQVQNEIFQILDSIII